jgi:hypothetical protein
VKFNVSFKYGRVDVPSFDELIDILWSEEVFVNTPVPFDREDRFVYL